MREITISKNDSGQRLDRFLSKAFPLLKQSLINKLLRKKRIKLNGSKSEPNTILKENDKLQLYLSDELLSKRQKPLTFLDIDGGIDIVFEDKNILLVNKNAGLEVHSENVSEGDTLINRVKRYLYEKGEYIPENEQSFTPALCNRLDRNTSGIVIVAKNTESLRILNQKIKDRQIEKTYLCLVYGDLPKNKAVGIAYLKKDSDKNKVVISANKKEGFLPIKTGYKLIEKRGDISLVEIDLITGRTHQIRAYMAFLGCFVLGDGKYGKNSINRQFGFKHQALCAVKLKFSKTGDENSLTYLEGRSFSIKEPEFIGKFNQI